MFRLMSDLKVVLYKNNRAPRSIALSTRTLYRTLVLAAIGAALLVACAGLAARFYLVSKARVSPFQAPPVLVADDTEQLPTGSPEAQIQSLRDQVELLKTRLQNATSAQTTPREIDKKNPALALFSPVVTDKTQEKNQVAISNFRYAPAEGKNPATLTFDLHNAHPGEHIEKGYIVVLARGETGLLAYPNVFNRAGPYLLDFEKGETFQVARFRLVNAQFAASADAFQILIFTRNGELLINTTYELKADGN